MGLIKHFLESETAAGDSEYSLLIFLLLASIAVLKVFSAVLNTIFVRAAGRITGAV